MRTTLTQAQFLANQQRLRQPLEQRMAAADRFDWQAPGHTVTGRVAEMTARYPDRTAVLDESQSLTYRQLDRASNRVANGLLAERGPGLEIVSLLLSPGAQAVVTSLGVLKAGKAFLGYDDVYSEARCRQILDDSDGRTIVADRQHANLAQRLAGTAVKLLTVEQLAGYPDTDPGITVTPDTIALLNYSSGSTGQPKGIIHTHHSALAKASTYAVLSGLNTGDRISNFSSLAWSATFWRFYGPLFFGAAVATIDVRRHDVTRIMDWLDETGVTLLMGRAYLRHILAAAGDRQFHHVRLVNLGGDTIYRQDVEACRRTFPEALVSVGMGTTEAGRSSEWLIDRETPLEEEVVHIGLPSPGFTIRLLDDAGREVAPGQTGEIALQSRTLARGYWKQPDLTAERFRQWPGEAFPIYLTGDTGRFRPDGALEHLGRRDFQIKIQGYQVPVGEIEGLLLAQPGVREACVVKQHARDGHDLLIAFISAGPDGAPLAEALQATLAARLPGYMVPHHIVLLPDLPKTATLKLDRAHMPAFDRVRPALKTPYAPAVSPTEVKLVAIWEAVLDLTPIGVDDRFLALGGDSLRAAQIANRVLAEFAVEISFATLLEAATVTEMARGLVEGMQQHTG